MHIQERLRIEKENFKEDTEIVERQDAELTKLKEWNNIEAAAVKDLEEKIAEQKKIKLEQESKNRHYQQTNTAYKAQRDFINTEYSANYTDTVGELNIETLREIMTSNDKVNQTIAKFS